MNAARIAVIVPVYNAGEYLPLCLASIAAQSFADFAAILVDDGSTGRLRRRLRCLGGAGRAFFGAAPFQRRCGGSPCGGCEAGKLRIPCVLRRGRPAAPRFSAHAAARRRGKACCPSPCCRFDTFRDAPALNAPPPDAHRVLNDPEHLDALLHDHRVDYSLCNKLYDAALMTPSLLNNGLTHNEDLLANWQAFLQVPGIAFCDFAGYHYRQHGDSSSHRALTPAEIDDHLTVARAILDTRPPTT